MRRFALATFVWLGLVGCAPHAAPLTPPGPYAEAPGSAGKRPGGPLVQEFYATAEAELAAGGDGSDTQFFIGELFEAEKLRLARAIVTDPDPRFSYFAISPLVESGNEAEAVPAVVAMMTSGSDLTGLGWYLAHMDDEVAGARLMMATGRYLLRHLGDYQGAARASVEQFLVPPPDTFSVPAAEARFREMESRLRAAQTGLEN